MQKSTILFLQISILSLLLSCGANPIVKNYTVTPLDKTIYQNNYFANSDMDYVYKTNITVYGNTLSGIFIAKKINQTTHRVVFTTEFGNKLLDFEISEHDFKVNAIVDELNKKILINILKTDFRILLQKDFYFNEQYQNDTFMLYKSPQNKHYNYLFINKKDNQLQDITYSSKRKPQFYIHFISENNTFAKKVVIKHYNIKLEMELNYLQN